MKIALLIIFFGISAAYAQINEMDTVVFNLAEASCSGNQFIIPVSFKSDDTVYAIDFSMQYDQTKIQFNSIVTNIPSVNASAFFNPADSTLRLTSFSMTGIPHDTPVVSLKFDISSYPVTVSDFWNIITYLNGDVCSYKIIPPSPQAVIVPMGSLTIFPGDSVGLTASAGNGFTYLWSTSDTIQTIYVTDAGTYSVTVTTPGGCTSSDSATITFSTPLPVELTDFTATQEQNYIQLEWTTASELNNDFFEVQRSPDESVWSLVARINGAGNTTSQHFYSTKDYHPIAGNNYYRLMQVDFDGTTSYSNVLHFNFVLTGNENNHVSFFPNPASDILNFSFAGNFVIEVCDINGKILMNKTIGKNDQQISVAQFDAGIYSLKIFDESNGMIKGSIPLIIIHR